MIKVLIVDDQQLLTDLLHHMLIKCEDIQVIGCAADGLEAIKLAEARKPDVILMDLIMPHCDGIEATRRIKQLDENVKILVLTTSSDEEYVYEALENGASGYVLKSISDEDLVLAIRSVHANLEVFHHAVRTGTGKNTPGADKSMGKRANGSGERSRITVNDCEVDLSERELAVIRMIVEGKEIADMAAALYLSKGRVRNIVTEITGKLMLKDRTQVAVFAMKNKLV